MTSEAQKRAVRKYQAEKTQMRGFRFGPGDADVLAHLDAQPNKSGYVKALIRADMERRSREEME